MIHNALSPLRDIITGQSPRPMKWNVNGAEQSWVERYGGVSRPLRIAMETENGTQYKAFPIRQGLSSEACYTRQRYTDLVPNSQYKNLTYCEVVTPMTQVKSSIPNCIAMQARVRLVFWLNLPAMGVDMGSAAGYADAAAASIVKALGGEHQNDGNGGKVRYINFAVTTSDPAIFAPYGYGREIDAMMLYPFDLGAVDFTVDYLFSPRCLPSLLTGAPIKCIEQW